jgi:chromosomal replication initiation ATPase DnaA
VTQLILPLNLAPAFEAKDFCVSKANEDAFLWLMRWPNWPTRCLALYGEEGCGKTHLSHIWQKRTKATCFSSAYFNALPLSTLLKMSPFFILDEADHIEKDAKLFHLYNHVISVRGGLLLLSNNPPAHWLTYLNDLRSRLNAIPAVRIHLPDENLLSQVLLKLFSDLQVNIDVNVIYFLINHMERSFESARKWVKLLNARALSGRRNITVPLVREILEEQNLGEIPA